MADRLGELPTSTETKEDIDLNTFSDWHIIIASNRGPVVHLENSDGEIIQQKGSGGLITGLSGMLQYIDASWISCAQTPQDMDFGEGDIPLEETSGHIHVKFIQPEQDVYEGYYNVIANPLLWFLQHSMWNISSEPIIDHATWDAWENGYKVVNYQFAEEIAKAVQQSNKKTLVMLQDYHLYLAARYIRQLLPRREQPTILHFTHIPWPGPEYWRILPPAMRQSILDGLCAVDVLGFQTGEDGLNFIRTVESHLPRAHVKYKRGRIWYRNHATHVKDFPISIDVGNLETLSQDEEVLELKENLKEIIGDQKLVLRVDRIDPSKNIIRGFKAFEELLSLHPEYREKVMFLALLVPSRREVEEYKDYLDKIMAISGQINAEYGTSNWEPVRILVGENYKRAIAALELYDVLLVNAVADGMNLVAKEGPIVNENNGVLVLSERAGASQQLAPGAIVISPCDVYATAEAIHQGLDMRLEDRTARAHSLRWLIANNDIFCWLKDQLQAVVELGRQT
ncbi:MAG: trehalose 6-phosphate synthase [Chloroflexota bacterium]|nr:trehalose 6-phosphate synthase [Chloroflexota bacterium]